MKPLSVGRPMGLAEVEEWLLNPPPSAQFKRNGRSPELRMETLYERGRLKVAADQRDRYNEVRSRAVESCDGAATTISEVTAAVEQALAAMRLGTGSPEDVMAAVREGTATLSRLHQSLDFIDRDAEAATAMIDTDPTEYQAAQVERFPMLAKAMPVVTEEWLLGDPAAPDPLGGAS